MCAGDPTTVLGLEKKLTKNIEMRMKHATTPRLFAESEVDLDDEVKKLHELAIALHPVAIDERMVVSEMGEA